MKGRRAAGPRRRPARGARAARRARPGGLDVEHAGDVLAADARGRPRLAHEALRRVGLHRELGQQELQRHARAELQVIGGEHDTHAAHPQLPDDPVLVEEDGARRKRRKAHGLGHHPRTLAALAGEVSGLRSAGPGTPEPSRAGGNIDAPQRSKTR